MTLPGIGPLIATALAVLAPPPEACRSARDFAAWLGLTPRQHSAWGKQRLGATTKMAAKSACRNGIPGHFEIEPDRQRAPALERFFIGRPIPGSVGRGVGLLMKTI